MRPRVGLEGEMKKIADVSVWVWATGVSVAVAAMIAGGWACMGSDPVKPSEDGLECFANSKRMLSTERTLALDASIVKYMGGTRDPERVARVKMEKENLERRKRAYDKTLARVKEQESIFHKESGAIERWLEDGRGEFKKLPQNEKDLKRNAERLDKEWEIRMETDLVDLLR